MPACEINTRLGFDPDTGIVYWIATGKEAGGVNNHGYKRVKIGGKIYQAHRVAWFLYFGEWPEGMIDHIDQNKQNNRISNLRICDHSLNRMNTRTTKGFSRFRDKFQARFKFQGKTVYLGTFETEEQAKEAYQKRKNQYLSECEVCQ